jgi:NADH-quinone oxidoreductase subunit E
LDVPELNVGSVNVNPEFQAIFQFHSRARENLIPILQEIQDCNAYLSPWAVGQVAEFLGISENDVYGVATFYSQFRFNPPGRHHIKVCEGTACHVRNSRLLVEEVTRKVGICPGETTKDREYSLEHVACFGSCALAPVVVLDDKVYGRMTTRKMQKLIEGTK